MPPSPSVISYLRQAVSAIGMSLLTLSVVTLGGVWDGFGQMNNDGLVMADQRYRSTTTLFSSTRTYLLLRLWQLSGSPGLEMQRLRCMALVVALPITLPRCFPTKTRSTIWEVWSTSEVKTLPSVGPVNG